MRPARAIGPGKTALAKQATRGIIEMEWFLHISREGRSSVAIQEDIGKIQINDDVIATIASLAAVEVDGIVSITGGSSLAEVWGSKGLKKGISVATDDQSSQATIDLEVNVEYGVDIYKAAHNLQRAVKNAVETMTGLRVRAVNVKIGGIVLGDQPRRVTSVAAAENPEAPK
jgi:uncharacterized alkaline shock family protein YloU